MARAGCAAGAAATGAGWRRAASPATNQATRAAAGTARTGAAPAVAGPRPHPTRRDTPAEAAAAPSPMPRGAAAPGAVALGTPTAPTAPPQAHRIAGTPRAETAVTVPPESPSPPR